MLRRVGTVVAVGAVLWARVAGAQLVQQGGKLVANDSLGLAWQGSAVAVSADGNTAIVGGYNDTNVGGAAWVFTRSGGVWSQQGAKLIGTGGGTNAAEGWSVAISGDGNTALIGGPGDASGVGAVWVFTRSGGTWTQQGQKLTGSGASGHAGLGSSVALSADGNTAIAGGPGDNTGAGAVWVFARTGTTWKQQGSKLVATGAVGKARLGTSVALSSDGSTLVASGPEDNNGTGAVWAFTQSGSKWTVQANKLVGSSPNTTFRVTDTASVTATFTQQPAPCYTLKSVASPSDGGQIAVDTPETCSGGYLPGTQIALFVTPTSDWSLAGWSGTGGSFSNISSIQTTFTITGNATVTASLLQQSTTCDLLTMGASPTDAGTAIVTTSVNCYSSNYGYTQGTNVLVKAAPATGYVFSGWTGTGGVFADTSAATTKFTLTGQATATANFVTTPTTCNPLTVSVNPASSGTVAVGTGQNCSGGYGWGTQVALAASPAPGWTFAGWSANGGTLSNPAGLSAGAKQGTSVGVSNDGNTVIFGGSVSASVGTVWVFNRSGSTWVQQGNPISVSGDASLAQQAWAVALSGDGNAALLGEPGDNDGTGAAWLFTRSANVWTQQGTRLVGTGANGAAGQGAAVALSDDAGTAVVGGPGDHSGVGAIWVFAAGASPACTFSLSPTWQGFGALGGTGTIPVTPVAGTDCPWVAASNVPWVAVLQGSSGTGAGQVAFGVSSNTGPSRSGTLDVAGQTFTVYQAGPNCAYALDSASATFDAGGGLGSFNVVTPADCPWSAAATVPWLHVTAGVQGIGNGAVSYTVDANAGNVRSGAITVGDQTFTVTQAAPPPMAAFGTVPLSPVAGEVVQFNDASTGFPTSWSWDFGDGASSQAQNPTHLYASAGTYLVALTVANATGQSTVSAPLAVTTGYSTWLPVASHVNGRNGAHWRSDIGILNPGTADATVQGQFHSALGLATGTIVLPAGYQSIIPDVVGVLRSSGSGALEVLSDQPVVVTSRTYDQLASGTVGQGYASYGAPATLGAGQSAWLPQLTENAWYRTNIALTNTGSGTAFVTVTLFDGLGVQLASYDATLAPGEFAQANQPFFGFAGQTALDQGYAKVTVNSGSGIVATATVADNLTNDPTTIAMTPFGSVTGAGSIWIPVVSHVQGNTGTQWRSDLGILNPGTAAAAVQGFFHGPDGVVSAAVSMSPGGQLIARDIVGMLGASGSGALEVVTDQPLVVTARTYDQQPGGTVGQGYAASTPASALGAGQSALLPQLRENASYRTNISLTNSGSETASVTVALFDASGSPRGSYDATLAPGGFAQANQPFLAHGGQTTTDGGYAKVTVNSGSGVIATASVIDNVTNDPTTVAMVK